MNPTGIHHISLVVTDIEKAKAFYGDVLRLQQLKRPPFTFVGLWYALGQQQLHLIEDGQLKLREKETSINTRGRHVAFHVSDFDETVRHLHNQGVLYIEKRYSTSGFHQVFINDPDGNTIEFMSEFQAE
ncbi:VOC family protein [Shouchella hunanensis]|uniref:VOC family protein n=1 Tax=Shouchella hunanensis TaxID=766894 RepID=A0ABY7WCD7_9BACI|nr:VOC family protein [Shouchella hunanensis]WDF05776.1 VOC family protein [Shouchella hunanensis]